MARDLLFEIGTEELPPGELPLLEERLGEEVSRRLKQAELAFSKIETFATPRRLAVVVHQLAEAQPTRVVRQKGPPVEIAFDEKGRPTKAALGFARRCGVTVEALTTIRDEKGERLFCEVEVPGKRAEELIPEIFAQSLAALPAKRRMRWGEGEVAFVRPVHWLVLLYGHRVVKAEILGLESDRYTYGHRFHAPHALEISTPEHYDRLLFVQGKVVASFKRRRERILEQLQILARKLGGRPLVREPLLDEVTALVEWPVAMWGAFEERFLELPPEVLITAMVSHQRYFPLLAQEEEAASLLEREILPPAQIKLLPRFLFVAGLESSNPETVRKGNERVIRPRLEDAQFFYRQDLKQPFAERREALRGILFHQKLGTLYDKSLRLEVLGSALAEKIGGDGDLARRAALLSKCDLTTEMVGEFPELQGTMGYYYAKAQGEPEEVARALEEQYRPRGAQGTLPETRTGIALAIADKVDTLVGIFSVGERPTGTKDPYGLRRAALGVIRIALEKGLDFDLMALLEEAANLYRHTFDQKQTVREVYDFIVDRLRGYFQERGYPHDEIEAVAAVRPRSLLDFSARLEAIHKFRFREARRLAEADKRTRNILRKAGFELEGGERAVDVDLLVEVAERELYRAIVEAEEGLGGLIEARAYGEALAKLVKLAEPLDRFFQEVLVMCDEEPLRQNRLALLSRLRRNLLQVADISQLAIS